jgi:hypothetical protein
MKNLGKIINFYAKAAQIIGKLGLLFMVLLVISLTIVLSVPGFQIHEKGFEISTDGLMATLQAIVGIVLLGSMALGTLVGVSAIFLIPEIFFEIKFKKLALQFIKEKQHISLSDFSHEVGINESTLWMMLLSWSQAPLRNKNMDKHLKLEPYEKQISWED